MDPERVLPHDIDAERYVLAGVLVAPETWDEAREVLRSSDFYRDAHRRLWLAYEALTDHGEAIEIRTVLDQLKVAGDLETVGGARYLAEMMDGMPRVSMGPWCRIVSAKARRREAIRQGARLVESGFDESEALDVSLENAQSALAALSEHRGAFHDLPMPEAVKLAVERLDRFQGTHVIGLPSGFPSLDQMTRGTLPTWLVTVAGRAKSGKTTALLQMVRAMAETGARGRHFPLEMDAPDSVARMLCSEAEVDKLHISDDGWQRVSRVAGRIQDLPVVWDDRPSPTAAEIAAACRRQQRTTGLDFVVVDHLQRMSHSEDSDVRGVGQNVKALKSLAMELKIVLLLGSQFNRKAENQEPTLADLKWSGAIEEESDMVIALHPVDGMKEKPYLPTTMLVLANRHGPTGRISLSFERTFTRFVETREFEEQARERTWQGKLESAD